MTSLLMQRPDLAGLPLPPVLPEGMLLREYREGDLAALAALLQAAFPDEVWTAERVRAALIDAPDVVSVFVIDAGPRLAATASARLMPETFPGSGYLHWVAAWPDLAGRRLGHAVTQAVLAEFARLGCRDAVLETDDQRLPAIKTYRNLGFRPVFRDDTHEARWAEIDRRLDAAR